VGRNKTKINESKLLFAGIAFIGILYGLIGAVNWWGVNFVLPFLFLFAILGGSLIIAGISFQVILQKSIEEQMGGRVFSVVNSARYLSIPVSSLLFGILLNKFPIYYIILFAGLAVLPIVFILAKVYFGKAVPFNGGVPGTPG
jgi:predicted MFS family arabinose efflux permease